MAAISPKMILKRIFKIRKSPKYKKAIHPSRTVLNGLIAYNQYGAYVVPSGSIHRPAVQKILKGKVYEPDTIQFMRENCGDGDIIHAGTFFGDFLPGVSGSLAVDARIWAFEPNQENFRCAQITLMLNGIENVVLMNLGLGEVESTEQMLIELESGMSLGGASRILTKQEKGKSVEIKVVRIDDIVPRERNISIIQLDVEGFEKEALHGGLETIRRCKPILILEDNNEIIPTEWFADNVLSLGYKVKGNLHHNTWLAV